MQHATASNTTATRFAATRTGSAAIACAEESQSHPDQRQHHHDPRQQQRPLEHVVRASMCTQVISCGDEHLRRSGLSRTVAGTSVIDRSISSTPHAATTGQASGQTTNRAAATRPAPSTDAMSRTPLQRRPHVERDAHIASQPNRATYAITTIPGPL